ncbi:MAG TPA: PorV/PorQ family protein, partial [Rhodothermales bacterium]
RAMTNRLSLGITAKYLRESLWDFSASTIAFDVGTAYDLGYKGLRLAMSAQNFGGAVEYLEEGDREAGYDLPLVFRIGVAVDVLGANGLVDMNPMHRMVLSAEAINTNDFSERLHIGTEYWFSDFLALRAGYRMNYDEGNWSLGFGLAPSFAGMDVRLDYAYVAYEFLDAPHRYTLTIGF